MSAQATSLSTAGVTEPPIQFQKGVAISVWQNSPDKKATWDQFAKERWPFSFFGVRTYKGKAGPEQHSNFWENYEQDLKSAKDLGCTSFRFSFEWSRLEPTQGKWDDAAVARYNQILDVMERLGMTPSGTLHHFVHPLWFDKAGAFLKEENIKLFLDFSTKVFKLFGHRVKHWATFNEPASLVFMAYVSRMMPTGNLLQPGNTGTALLNILKSHVKVYRAIKAMPGGDKTQIGLVHLHMNFEPAGTGPLYWPAIYMTRWLTKLAGNSAMEEWMMTGKFVWELPLYGKYIDYQEPGGKPPCDFWGINYYSRGLVSWALMPTCKKGETMCNPFPYAIHPDGLYETIKKCSQYGMPMYITETGCPAEDNSKRSDWIVSYWDAVMRAIADGYDVRGLYYWTLIDNFEWSMGYEAKFGLYNFQPDGKNNRTLKESSKPLARIYKTVPDDMKDLKALALRENKQGAKSSKQYITTSEEHGGHAAPAYA